jgi:hypothetical protein
MGDMDSYDTSQVIEKNEAREWGLQREGIYEQLRNYRSQAQLGSKAARKAAWDMVQECERALAALDMCR